MALQTHNLIVFSPPATGLSVVAMVSWSLLTRCDLIYLPFTWHQGRQVFFEQRRTVFDRDEPSYFRLISVEGVKRRAVGGRASEVKGEKGIGRKGLLDRVGAVYRERELRMFFLSLSLSLLTPLLFSFMPNVFPRLLRRGAKMASLFLRSTSALDVCRSPIAPPLHPRCVQA